MEKKAEASAEAILTSITKIMAYDIVCDIVVDLLERSGLRETWESISKDCQEDIMSVWRQIIFDRMCDLKTVMLRYGALVTREVSSAPSLEPDMAIKGFLDGLVVRIENVENRECRE